MPEKIGTLFLQTRKGLNEKWHTINQLDFSSELGYFTAYSELENMRARYVTDHRFIGHSFNIKEKSNAI